MLFDWDYTLQILPQLAQAAVVTIEATLLGFALAAPFGLLLAILRMVPGPYVAAPVIAIIEFIRSTPLLIQIFYFYFVILPVLHMTPSAFAAGVFAIGIHYGTYCSEVFRAGLENIPRGQWEASIALNLSTYRTFRDVILPQAIPPVVPALGNYLVALFKETPLLAAISASELMSTAKAIGNENFRYTEPITLVGVFFLAMSLVSAGLIRLVEYRLNARYR
jgi:polar amino acid transport system permease protein